MLEVALRRDRAVPAAGLLGLAALAWYHIARMATTSAAGMAQMAMPGTGVETTPGLGWLVAMWAVMMVAMMLPSAAPAILLFSSVSRRRREHGRPAVPVIVFTFGYLMAWGAYAAVAAAAQWELHRLALLSPAMASASPILAGLLLVAAGVYQWLPLKTACLSRCRTPLGFFTTEWREGARGALVMGMRHGSYCVGCCWLLMALLLVAGVMNLVWVAAIAAFVLVEKLVRGGPGIGKAAGIGLAAWGVWLLAS